MTVFTTGTTISATARPKPSPQGLGRALPLLCLALAVPAFGQNGQAPAPTQAAAPGTSQAVQSPAPAGQPVQQPAPPQTPNQQPPAPPQVSFRNGELTVLARNSQMSDVLRAIGSATGAKIQGGAGGDRVFGQFGPGSPRDVLESLLSGSPYNYVLLANGSDPNAINEIILTPRGAGSVPVQTVAAAPRPATPGEENNMEPEPPPDADAPEEMPQPPENIPQNAQEQQNNFGQPQPAVPQQGNDNANQQNNGVKTPEQLLEELRRLRQNQGNAQGQPPQ